MKFLHRSSSALCLVLAMTGVWGVSAPLAHAEGAPDAGSLLRSYEQTVPPAPRVAPDSAPITQTAPSAQPQEAGVKVLVQEFDIESTRIPSQELQTVLADLIGKELSMSELQGAARRVSDYYRDKGYLVRVVLPPQTIRNGTVKIRVIEGTLGKVTVDPASESRLDPDIAQGLVEDRMPVGQIMQPDALREGMMILNEVPGVSATASLEPGQAEGETNAVIKLNDKPLLSGAMQVGNEGMRSVGTVRGIASFAINNGMGVGDQETMTLVKTGLSNYGRLAVSAPVGASGLTLGLNGSAMDYKVDEDFNSADQKGYAYTAGATAAYPVIRSADASLSAFASYDHKILVNSVLGLNSSNKGIDVGSVGVSAVLNDTLWQSAVNTFDATISAGRLDLSRNDGNLMQDQASAKTNGLYSKYTARATRLQTVTDSHKLYVSANMQYAPQNLDSSEQISLGGPDGVRAYPVNEGMGAHGFLARVEWRYNVLEQVQLFPFYDAGWVQQYEETWSGWNNAGTPNNYWLQGLGAGVSWRPVEQAFTSLILAHTLGTNPGKLDGKNSDGYNDHLRFWVKAGFVF